MYGVESLTSAVGIVRAPFGHGRVSPAPNVKNVEREPVIPKNPGALAGVRDVLKQTLGSTGFVDLTGPQQANFKTYLNRSPVEMDIEDLRPGLLNHVASWVVSKINGEPDQALRAQANTRREIALKLLT